LLVRNLAKMLGQVSLAHASVAVDIEEESTSLVISGQTKVLSVLDHLILAADEAALLSASDEIL
jgi:hypothetical protein